MTGLKPSVAEARVRKLESKMLMLVIWNRLIEVRLGELGSKILQGALELPSPVLLPVPRLVSHGKMVAGSARSVTNM